tara:strand:- start:7985 stop:8551 length:567 start_codon:yes stop_codon:yes gene_type:complete
MSIVLKYIESNLSNNVIHLKISYNASIDITGIQFTLNLPVNVIESASYSSDNNNPNFTSPYRFNSDAGSGTNYIKNLFYSETPGNKLSKTDGLDVIFSYIDLNLRSDAIVTTPLNTILPVSIELTFNETICCDINADEVSSSGIDKLLILRPAHIGDIAYINNSMQSKNGYINDKNSNDLDINLNYFY